MLVTALLSQLLIAVPSIILGTQTLTSVFNGFFKVDKPGLRQLVSWIFSILIAIGFVATGNLTFGLPVVWEYIVGIVSGVLAGGAANGFYDWAAISAIFNSFENVLRGEKRVKE